MTALPSRLVLLGHPVDHSISPAFQNAALRSLHLPLVYEALDTPPAQLGARLDELRAAHAAGNVTIPHKESVAARCARLTPIAERVGAVNTFWVDADGALVGDNTDVAGFDHLARVALAGATIPERVTVLGAGGAAAAVLAAIERWPACRVSLFNRSPARLERLAARFHVVDRATTDLNQVVEGSGLVVNATPVGQSDDAFPVGLDSLERDAVVVDLVYRRGETAWVRAARARGRRGADGLEMLLEQGALAFERWLGVSAPREVMRSAVSGSGEGAASGRPGEGDPPRHSHESDPPHHSSESDPSRHSSESGDPSTPGHGFPLSLE